MSLLLLDTHAFVWSVSSPAKLSERARAAIADRTNSVVVSAASAWELATKARLGKMPEAVVLVAQYERLVTELHAGHLSISPTHALLAGDLEWDHRDPFDRMLAVQSVHERAVLVTKDRALSDFALLRTLW